MQRQQSTNCGLYHSLIDLNYCAFATPPMQQAELTACMQV